MVEEKATRFIRFGRYLYMGGILLALVVALGFLRDPIAEAQAGRSEDAPTPFGGARSIVGDASTAIEDSAFIVEKGRRAGWQRETLSL